MAKTVYSIKTLDGNPVRAEEAWKDSDGGLLNKKVTTDTDQTIDGVKTFSTYAKIDEIDNTSGNALVRHKATEGKNVFGGVNHDAVIMGKSDRPFYSKDGADFNGKEIALVGDENVFPTTQIKRKTIESSYETESIFEQSSLAPYTNENGKLTFTNNLGSASYTDLIGTNDLEYDYIEDLIIHTYVDYTEKTASSVFVQISNTDGSTIYREVPLGTSGEVLVSVNGNTQSGKTIKSVRLRFRLFGAVTLSYLEVYQYLAKDKESTPVQKLLEKVTAPVSDGNMIDFSDKQDFIIGRYFPSSTGSLPLNANYAIYKPYIPVIPGKAYSLCNFIKTNNGVLNYMSANTIFYNRAKEAISFAVVNWNNYTIPEGAYFIRFAIVFTNYHLFDDGFAFLMKEGKIYSSSQYQLPNCSKLMISKMPTEVSSKCPKITKITVGSDASASFDFTSFRKAIESITDASATHRYEVYVYEGTYELRDDYTDAEVSTSGWEGLVLPNYVRLIGVGDKEKIIVKLTLSTPMSLPSCLNLKENCEIENMTFDSVNCRYTIHDDDSTNKFVSHRKVFKHCDFIAQNSYYAVTYGVGMHGSNDWLFKDCKFELKTDGMAMYMHNRISDGLKPESAKATFVNCRFIANSKASAYTLNTLSGANELICYVSFYGCKLGDLTLKANDGYVGCDWYASGYGNQIGTVSIVSNDSDDYSSHIDFI